MIYIYLWKYEMLKINKKKNNHNLLNAAFTLIYSENFPKIRLKFSHLILENYWNNKIKYIFSCSELLILW